MPRKLRQQALAPPRLPRELQRHRAATKPSPNAAKTPHLEILPTTLLLEQSFSFSERDMLSPNRSIHLCTLDNCSLNSIAEMICKTFPEHMEIVAV